MENLSDLGETLNTEIVCTLAGLGYSEGSDYYKSPDCLESLKDLVRFLRRDDTTCEIRRQLGYSEVLQNDLVAILKSCSSKEKDIFDMVIRLMVNLTQPAVLCFGNNIPEDRTGQHYYLDLVTQLQSYKEAFTEKEVMSVIGRELGRLLQMEWDERLEEDSLLIERILLLIRNILHVPANKQAEKRTDDDASIHDQVIWNLHTNGIDDLLLFIASSPDEQRWSMHILEIVSLMFREQNPESLAKAGQGRSTSEKKDDKRQLEVLHQQELADKLNKARKFSGRHSRFGGTFYVQNMKSIDDKNQLIYHRPLAEVKNMSFDHNKTAPKKRKKQLPAKEMGEERRSTLSIRLFLKRFCTGFLQNCYNPLMHAVKDNLKHGRSQENDETYFLWAMRFFMEFSRHHDFRVDYIGETLSVVSFTDLLNIIIKFYDGMESNKAEALTWGRRLHLAIQAYKELLFNVSCMIKSDLKDLRNHAKIIQGNVFYTAEYRDTFLLLLRKFQVSKHTKSYLRDLIEAFHVFLKMLEKYCSGKSHIIVQKKKKITKKKKRTAPAATPANWTPEETEQKWQDLASDLSAVLQGHAGDIPESIVPFDAASEIPVDEQKTHALSQIQGFLRNQQCADAVALLRAARDVWADDEQFGSAGISAEDEFICLNNIFKMDLPPVNTANENDDEEEQEEETIPEEEEMAAVQPRETEFSIQEFLNKLATPSVIQPYCWLLKFYKENKEFTNHAIIKMLHRVAIDLKTPSMLFQLSLFNTFHTILSDPSANQYKEMVKFTRYIVAKFFEKLPKNSVLLAELVIWKSTKDCYEIEEGYGSLEFRSASTNTAVWTFEEEEELRQLYDEYKGSDDLVDTIMEKMSSDTKSRRQIIKKLVAMKLVTNRKELHKKAVKKGAWSEEETEQLRALFDEYKNSEEDIVEKIMEHMLNPSKTRRQVVNQLVNMGIVEDRKMLRKKRKKGERKRKKSNDDGFVVDDDNEDEESEGGHSDMEEGFDHQPSSSNGESEEEEEQDSDDSDDTLTNIISKLKSEGLGEQLKWIQSKLQRIADDRQNTDNKTWQPLPLVTITEENEEALSNKLFKKALKKVGLKPPANEQETFWRIPVALNSDKLRKAVEDLNGKDTGENEEGNGAVPSPVNDKSKSRKETLAALAAARKKNGSASTRKRKERITKRASGREWRKSLKETTTESDGENHSDEESCDGVSDVKNATPPLSGDQNGTSKKRSKRRVKRLDDSDEDELDEENLLEQRQEGLGNGYLESDDERTSNVLVKADNVRSDIEEDNLEYSTNISDSEDISNNTETSKSEAGKKRPRIESDDSDSDDDEEFNLPLSYHKRARRVLLDDNDDNE